jgi:hypothetical protein
MVAQQTRGTAVLGHEYRCVPNARAKAAAFALHVELPIGAFVDEPRRVLFAGEKQHDLGAVYLFNVGRRCVPAKVKGNELQFTPISRFTDNPASLSDEGQPRFVAGFRVRLGGLSHTWKLSDEFFATTPVTAWWHQDAQIEPPTELDITAEG